MRLTLLTAESPDARRGGKVPATMAVPPARKPAAPRPDLDRPWEAGDSIPLPEAVHRDGDSAWALWNEVAGEHERPFAETGPMTQPPGMSAEEIGWSPTVPAGGKPLPHSARHDEQVFTLEAAMLVARRNNRVCPRPERWNEFVALLPPRKTLRGWAQPPVAPTGAAWPVTAHLTKRLCFREQIEWAERAGVLESAIAFMQSLPEDEWLHMGED